MNADEYGIHSHQEAHLMIPDGTNQFRIQVAGFLDEVWSSRLGGMQITSSRYKNETITTLTGLVVDQAALFGVLIALYNMRYPLISVECLDGH